MTDIASELLLMPLDHYVSQVHLRNFAAHDGMLRVVKKSDLKSFPAKTQDVCRIEDGNNNPFLKEERLIEEYLKEIEPRYNASVQKLREDKIDQAAIHAIAGFVIYIIVCSPTGGRLHSKPLEERLLIEAKRLELAGAIADAPEALGNKKLSTLVEEGIVKFDVDPKYPQAIGINDFHDRISLFGNSQWEILLNSGEFGAYFSSDYPVAIETFDIDTPVNRIVPLAPDIAVRIIPDKSLKGQKADLSFSGFRSKRKTAAPKAVMELNRKIVQCAEDMVFYGHEGDWIAKFIRKNRLFRIESATFPVVRNGKKGLLVSHRIKQRHGAE